MSNNWKNTEKERRIVHSTIQRIERIHPFKTALYLSMAASGAIWLFILGGYAFTLSANAEVTLAMPKAFIVSTLMLLVSSYSLSGLVQAFQRDEPKSMVKKLGVTLVLAVLFAISQFIGWLQLSDTGFYNSAIGDSPYFHILSAFHLLHVLVGLAAMVYAFIFTLFHTADPVKNLILITNPFQKLKLELLVSYWHYLNATWVVLFLYFLFIALP